MNIYVTVTKKNTTKFPLHLHKQLELICYVSGHGVLKTPNESFEFEKDTIIAVPPGIMHGSQSDYEFKNICVYTDFDIPVCGNSIIYTRKGTPEQATLFNLIRHFYFDVYNENIIINLTNALKNMIFTSDTLVSAENNLIQVRKAISENFNSTDFFLKDIIDASGYSDDYFRTIFKQKYGVTPLKYLTNLRMDYAKSLIASYSDSLKLYEIANRCGYNDSLYFSRLFKKHFCISPSNYIKRNKGE